MMLIESIRKRECQKDHEILYIAAIAAQPKIDRRYGHCDRLFGIFSGEQFDHARGRRG